MNPTNKISTDPLPLTHLIDGEIREIRAIVDVRDCASNAHQSSQFVARRDDYIRIRQHAGDRCEVIHGPTLGQSRPSQHINKLARRKFRLDRVAITQGSISTKFVRAV
jgi:hypothetical protein